MRVVAVHELPCVGRPDETDDPTDEVVSGVDGAPGREPMVDDLPEGYDPTAVVMEGLAAASRGESYDEDAMEEASLVLAAVALMKRGLDFDTATRIVDQAADNGLIRIRWDDDDGLSVSITRDEADLSGAVLVPDDGGIGQ